MTSAEVSGLPRASRCVGLPLRGGGLASVLRGTMDTRTATMLADADARACPGSEDWAEVTDMVLRSVFPSMDGLPITPPGEVRSSCRSDGSHYTGKSFFACYDSTSGDGPAMKIALPGHGSPRLGANGIVLCGTPTRVLSDTEGHVRGVPSCCGRPDCPNCYPRVALKQAESIVTHIEAEVFLRVHEGRCATIRHWVLSAPKSAWADLRTEEGFDRLRAEARKRAKLLFPDGGEVLIFHPYRQLDKTKKDPHPAWVWGPHWHVIAVGAVDCTKKTLAEVRRGGWRSKAPGPEDVPLSSRSVVPLRHVPRLARYIVSHAGVSHPDAVGKKGKPRYKLAYTYVGSMNPRSKGGLRAVASDSEAAFPTVLGEDMGRRYLWDVEGLDAVRTSVHGTYDLRPYVCARKRTAFAHVGAEDLKARARAVGLERFGLEAPPNDWRGDLRLELRMSAPLAVSECVGRDDVYVAIVREVDGPTVSELEGATGVREPSLGDRWTSDGGPSLMDLALDSWRTDRRGYRLDDVIALVECGMDGSVGE